MLCAKFPEGCCVDHVTLGDAKDLRTWTLHGGGEEWPLTASTDLLHAALGGSAQTSFVQVDHNDVGQHLYVGFGQVLEFIDKGTTASALTIVTEDEVKALKSTGRSVLILPTVGGRKALHQGYAPAADVPADDLDLCPPASLYRNYNIVEDLTLGRFQRIMLSDEHTLQTGIARNGVKIFNHLSLIVNCHESRKAHREGKYNVGTANPKILYHPIHELISSPDRVITVMDEIQEQIWESQQEGSIAVHCLAGVHRAPTVVVCQYLYRHYILGQKHICNDVREIYRRLQKIRPGVAPLSYITLIDIYHRYLIQKAGGAI